MDENKITNDPKKVPALGPGLDTDPSPALIRRGPNGERRRADDYFRPLVQNIQLVTILLERPSLSSSRESQVPLLLPDSLFFS